MSRNKMTVENYLEGFRRGDHARILACLTDDIVWEVPGAFLLTGKAAFDAEIENPAFVGRPTITTSAVYEDGDVVVTEGTVATRRADGEMLHLRFCDVFVMRDGLIRKLTSYLMPVKP